MALAAPAFAQVLADNPFSPAEPRLQHLVLLPAPLDEVCREQLLQLAADDTGSRLAVAGRAVYLDHPQGFATSRLARRATALLDDGTARNLATLAALAPSAQDQADAERAAAQEARAQRS